MRPRNTQLQPDHGRASHPQEAEESEEEIEEAQPQEQHNEAAESADYGADTFR